MASQHSKHPVILKAFGKAMRQHRGLLGLSQEALADRAQLDRSYMSQIERGIKNVTLNSIWRIAQALNVQASELLRLTEEIESTGSAGDTSVKGTPTAGRGTLESSAKLAGPGHQAISSHPHAAHSVPLGQTPHLNVSKRTVLVVDDDEDICFLMDSVLKDAGFQTVHACSGFDAVRILASVRIDAVVSDIRMANGNGIELLETMRKHYPKVPVFFITGYDDVTQEDAIKRGARGLFSKPFDMRSFVISLRSSIAH